MIGLSFHILKIGVGISVVIPQSYLVAKPSFYVKGKKRE